ncbi:ABC transporter ATPase [Solibacillus sp. FSL W7-1464]|uniref:ABC transporter ATPase n=1 Tax=Solibacillus sp. FSL W7-1464 TaxID=2921706 RepID=UPI0030F970F1
MLKKLSEQDFSVLRGPLESGRQSPNSLTSVLVLGIFLQALCFYLTYNIAGKYTIYPKYENIKTIHMWFTGIIILLSLLFAIPFVFKKMEKLQYFLSIIMTQNFSVFFFLSPLFLLGEQDGATVESLLNLTWITLSIAGVLFIATWIRFYLLLKKGHYRAGSRSEEMRGKFETKSYIPIVIIGSTALVFLIQFVVKFGSSDLYETITLVFLPFGIFYTLIFVLPEQLVILYCKIRFKSFNFDINGYLNTESAVKNNRKVKQS